MSAPSARGLFRATVYRAGRDEHLVDGQPMPTRKLRAMAAQWRADQAAEMMP